LGWRSQIERLLLREGGRGENCGQEQKQRPSETYRHEIKSSRQAIAAPNRRSKGRILGKPRLSASTALF
jgi:hypothetical protein